MLPTLALKLSQVSYTLGLVTSVTMSHFKSAHFVGEYFHSLHETSSFAGQTVNKDITTKEGVS